MKVVLKSGTSRNVFPTQTFSLSLFFIIILRKRKIICWKIKIKNRFNVLNRIAYFSSVSETRRVLKKSICIERDVCIQLTIKKNLKIADI